MAWHRVTLDPQSVQSVQPLKRKKKNFAAICPSFNWSKSQLSKLSLFSKNPSLIGQRACFQFTRTERNCANFDPGTAGRVFNGEDVFQAGEDSGNNNTDQATHSPQTQLLHAELEPSIFTQFDINKARSRQTTSISPPTTPASVASNDCV